MRRARVRDRGVVVVCAIVASGCGYPSHLVVGPSCGPGLMVMCGATCRDLAVDPANCGMCGNVCAGAPRGVPSCASGVCGFTCNPGFADCDGMTRNGCETHTPDDVAHCGACAM